MTDRKDKDRSPESSKPPEYERFEDLTRKLLKVPKAELDKRRNGAPRRTSGKSRHSP